MKMVKLINRGMVVFTLATFLFVGSVFAGAGEGPADLGSGVICDPAVWAVVVIQTSKSADLPNDPADYKISIRAKQIVDCNVEKDAYFLELTGCDETTSNGVDCPLVESDFINFVFGPSLFNIGNPIITKIKNFSSEPDPNDTTDTYTLISFDAQLKAYDASGTCPDQ